MADHSKQRKRAGRPPGSSNVGKKRNHAAGIRGKRHPKKSKEAEDDTRKDFRAEIGSETGQTDSDCVASTSASTQQHCTDECTVNRVIDGNIEMDTEDTPWLPPGEREENEVQDTDTSPFGYDEAKEIFHSVHRGLPKSDEKTVAVSIYSYFVDVLGWGINTALEHTKKIVDRDIKTIRTWRDQFYENGGDIPETAAGKYERQFIFNDEDLREKVLEYIRQNTCVKGRPNMRVADFRTWINNELLPSAHLPPQFARSVSLETARMWLHKLGFSYTDKKKGTYVDGHEREDVKESRSVFVQKMSELEQGHLPPPKCVDEIMTEEERDERALRFNRGDKRLVLLFHDESAFSANDDQRKLWTDGNTGHMRPKGRGSGIMISDFIEEHDGYLRLNSEEMNKAKDMGIEITEPEARHKFEYGQNREGYWDKDKFIHQVKRAVDIARVKYPPEENTVVWLFDQSSGHCAFGEDALNANRLNLNPGGKQPKMRDTEWQGQPQKLVFETGPNKGKPKGAHQILLERGFTSEQIKELKLDGCVKELKKHPDFANETCVVEKLIADAGQICLFLPKYHCELNPIERCWGKAKVYTRGHCNYSITGLRQVWRDAMETVTVGDIRKYFRRVREYLRAYREGNDGVIAVEKAVKIYKSHRRVHHTK